MSGNEPPLSPTEVRAARINDTTDTLTKAIQKRLFNNYKRFAYIIIVGTYFLAFGEYLYLRLTSILFSDNVVYTRTCAKHQGEVIVRGFWHYLSTLICFTSVGIIQLVCFFLLTVSRHYMHFRRKYKNFISMEEKLQCELIIHIKTIMYNTAIPAFLVYSMTSCVVFTGIFYMFGLRDEVPDTPSRIFIYCFDAVMILYFVAFPLITFIYHPDIQCSIKKCFSVPDTEPALANNTSAAHLTAYKSADEDIQEPENLRVRITTTV